MNDPIMKPRTVGLLLVTALWASTGVVSAEPCVADQVLQKKKAKTAIVSYPNASQEFFKLQVHVGLVSNYRSDLQGPTSPITAGQRPLYCGAVNQWAKNLYVATEGLYRIERADFWNVDGDLDRGDFTFDESPFDIYWLLGWAFDGAFWPSVPQHVDGQIYMSDIPVTCTGERFIDSDDQFTITSNYRCDADLLGINGANSCQLHEMSNGSEWGYCASGGGLAEPNARYWGNVLHHEGGHYLLGLPDESYRRGVCFGELPREEVEACGSLPAWKGDWIYDGPMDPLASSTSVMAAGFFRHNFCDPASHLHFAYMNDSAEGGGELIDHNVGRDEELHASMWEILRQFQPGFDNGPVHVDGVFDTLDRNGLPDIECVFHDDVLRNDPLMILDRSGSMSFNLPGDPDYTALVAAKEAAVNLYNLVPDGIHSGIIAYNANTTTPVDYQPVDYTEPKLAVDDLAFDAFGLTDIATAIRTGKDLLLQAQAAQDNLTGAMILLSDGNPTIPDGMTEFEVWADTVFAAVEACEEGSPPIRVIAMAFGDANEELLNTITSICDGELVKNGGNRAASETPLDYKETFTRVGYEARSRREVLHERERVQTVVTSYPFRVAPGSADLEFTWLGKPRTGDIAGGNVTFCGFDEFGFKVESPSGSMYDAATITPVGSDELTYGVRTARILGPEPGIWSATLVAPQQCVDVAPEIVWLASLRNGWYSTSLALSEEAPPRDRPVAIEASMYFADRPIVGVDIELEVWNRGVPTTLFPVDDGTGSDREAGDGIYTAVFPGLAPGEPAGALTVDATFKSIAGVSFPIPPAFDPIQDGPISDGSIVGMPLPGDAVIRDETTLVMIDCCEFDDPACAACPPSTVGTAVLARGEPGGESSVEVCGLPLVPGRVQIGAGPDLLLSNVSTTYDPQTRCGTIAFTADVDPDAPLGPRTLKIGSAGRRLRVDDAVSVCTAGLLPFIDVVDRSAVACGTTTGTVQLVAPSATRGCGETGPLSLTASVVSINGVQQVPPIPVPATLQIDLPAGVSEIEWRAVDLASGAVATAIQRVEVTLACGSGRIPAVPTVYERPLLLGRQPDGTIVLTWGGSCVSQDVDFAVYRGFVNEGFESYSRLTCSTGGGRQWSVSPDARGNDFYLVVPHNGNGQEGSYGMDSSGLERAPADAACFDQVVLTCE